MIIRNITWATY